MTTALQLSHVPTIGSLEGYQQMVQSFALLSEEEERALAVRYAEQNDLDAARRMVLSHLRFVVRVARSYSGYGLQQADLIQEGNVGLMKAVRRFDPTVGVRLVSFAVHWIRAEIHEYILRNWRIVKVATTKSQRKLFFNLRSAKKHLGWLNQEEIAGIAEDLGVSPETVVQMEQRLHARDAAYDGFSDDSEGERPAPAAYLPDTRLDPAEQAEADDWAAQSQAQLRHALAELDDRTRAIVTRRWLVEPKSTLQELADEYGVSAERIRQLEKNALKNLRGALET
jgi:RNA polymerase sigma-32 factor